MLVLAKLTASNAACRAHILYRGDAVDMAKTGYDAAMRDFEAELMLLVNERLYQKSSITAEMYIKAKELIFKAAR